MSAPTPSVAALRYLASALATTTSRPPPACSISVVAAARHSIRSVYRSSPSCRFYNQGTRSPPIQHRPEASFQAFNDPSSEVPQPRPTARRAKQRAGDAVDRNYTVDEKIESTWVQVKLSTGGLGDRQTLQSLLFTIDRDTEVVRQLRAGDATGQAAIVQIDTRERLLEQLRSKEQKTKESQKQQRLSKPKQVELNWAISENDLQLKLRQIRQFVEKGRRVEVLLASKKRARRATPEEADHTMDSIRTLVREIEGCKELKPMEGKVGGQALLILGK